MNNESSPELTKSWVFVDSEKQSYGDDTSGVQEIENEPHIDSDTDSISVISESGCSYKTDEEEFITTGGITEKEELDNDNEQPENLEKLDKEQEIAETVENEVKPETIEVVAPRIIQPFDENKAVEKLLYFATSAVCAIILVGFSVAVQHYFQDASNVNTFDPDQVFPYVQNLKPEAIKERPPSKFSLKRKSQLKLDELDNKIAKLQEGNDFHDKVLSSNVNDPKSNYKPNKNKNVKPNKENCDVSEKRGKPHDLDKTRDDAKEDKKPTDETYAKKVKELKIKEDYLREKEKFLIEKEHDLLKKEIELIKEKQDYVKNKHDKKSNHKKDEEYEKDSSEEVFTEHKGKYKTNKEHAGVKNNKKYKYKKEKKQHSTQKRYRFPDENRKRNLTGHWYMNLHEGRDNMRQKKRASFKKNKANWYFQWMVDRARLRVK